MEIVLAAYIPSSADKGASGPPRRVFNHPGQHYNVNYMLQSKPVLY